MFNGRIPKLNTAATASQAMLNPSQKAKEGGEESKGENSEGGDEGGAAPETASPAAEEKKGDEVVSYEGLKVDSAMYRRDLELKAPLAEPTLSTCSERHISVKQGLFA